MKTLITILILIFSSGVIMARPWVEFEKVEPIPVKHWEVDYFNCGFMVVQNDSYLFLLTGVRYNFDQSLFDVGGEFIFRTTPDLHHDALELKKGDIGSNGYLLLGPVAHYNFDRGEGASFYVGLGLGLGLGYQNVFSNYIVDSNGERLEEWDTERHFVAALTPRIGMEYLRHFRIGLQVQIPTDGNVTVGPYMGLVLGGGKKRR